MAPKNTSGYKGVSWHVKMGKWRVQIMDVEGKQKHIGYYSKKVNALKAYKNAYKNIHDLEKDEDLI
jgi:hypothetical protein